MANDETKRIEEQLKEAQTAFEGRPPIDKWTPELSGDIDIHIQRDGTWLYKGKPLAREALMRLFSTILRKESDGEHYLVTPVEKWRVEVEDTSLIAHSVDVQGEGQSQKIFLTLNTGETLLLSDRHPLRMETYADSDEPRPLVDVVHGLEARLVTAAYYDLAECVVPKGNDDNMLGVWSDGNFYELGTQG
ncbi:DUF1285 domain-containing protein [Marinobacter fonticola]|uniref:DUF1285 domain-containing protein n=1 Tax=Marinobacter fonticola TaxID=2603215 RepID=UPI0011E73A38|nr:DUF1285 domain-containing protein [Marinobacter fonticola]